MWLLLLIVFIMPFEASPYLQIADSFAGIPDFTVIKLLGLLGFAWALLKIATGDGGGLFSSPPARLLVAFYFGLLVAAFVWGSGYVALVRYLAFVLFLPVVLVAVRTYEDLRKVLTAMALSLILVFPYGVRQMIRFDSRFGTGLHESNYLAANLLLVIPLAFVLARQQATQGRRLAWMAGGGVLLVSLFLTSSRGGFLGLVVAGLLFAYRQRGVGAAAGLLVALTIAPFLLPTDLGTRTLGTLLEDVETPSGLEQSNRAHLALFWAGLRMIGDAPITGVGPENFKDLSTLYSGLDRAYIGHNTYLEIGAELGLPVLAVFLALVAATFTTLRRASRLDGTAERRHLAQWADALRTGLLGFLVAGFFISAQYEKRFWLTVFLSIAVDRVARALPRPEAAEPAAGVEDAYEPARAA